MFRGYSAEGLVTNGEGWVFVLSKDEGEVFWLFGATFTPLSDTDEPVTLTSYGRFDISMMSPGERTKVMAADSAADYDPERRHLLVLMCPRVFSDTC